jgi:BarA-like signal transduction histidine kinase
MITTIMTMTMTGALARKQARSGKCFLVPLSHFRLSPALLK